MNMWPKEQNIGNCRIHPRVNTLLGDKSSYTYTNSKSKLTVGVIYKDGLGKIIINNKEVATKTRNSWTATSGDYTLGEIENVLYKMPVKSVRSYDITSAPDFSSCYFRGMSGL